MVCLADGILEAVGEARVSLCYGSSNGLCPVILSTVPSEAPHRRSHQEIDGKNGTQKVDRA